MFGGQLRVNLQRWGEAPVGVKDERDEIARYGAGSSSISQINSALAKAWETILSQPDKRKEAAGALGVTVQELEDLADPPVLASPGPSGITATEVAILLASWFGTEIVLGS